MLGRRAGRISRGFDRSLGQSGLANDDGISVRIAPGGLVVDRLPAAGLVLLVGGFGVFRLGATLPVVVSALIVLGLLLAYIRRPRAAGDSEGTPFIPPGDAA